MVTDKVVNHLQLGDKVFFIVTLASEIKANRIKDFFALDPGEFGFLHLFAVFLKLATAFSTSPKPVKETNTTGFKVMPLATAEVIAALPATMLQNRFFL